ncbi:MAG: hypothetical protein FWF78_03555 [Defluviitaleaceae bacterium]|nr:hypothetical protein [Defluviitaleaceae bacterium]
MDKVMLDNINLVDIRSVKIDKDLPIKDRIADFINQIKDPYHYKCGKVTVMVSFADTTDTLEDRLEGYLASL